jgi:trigger factor
MAKDSMEETPQALATQDDETLFVEPPTFEVDYKGDCAYEVKVSVPAANKAHQRARLVDELGETAEVPGFRPGRAPKQLLLAKFGKAIATEADGKLISAAFEKLIEDEKLLPISPPDIDGLEEGKESSADQPIEVTFKFEVAPRVELGNYRGLKVERPVVTVDEKDVDEAIDNTRDQYATYEPFKGKAAEGDQVTISFEGTVDGEVFAGGSATEYPYVLGTKRFFPEFEEGLKGAKKGEELTLTVQLPDDLPNDDIKGKEAQFTIKVDEVKRKKKPELDEAFAKELGHDSVDDMRASVKTGLQAGSAQQSQSIVESRLVSQIVEASTFEIAETTVESTTQGVVRDYYQEIAAGRLDPAVLGESSEEFMAKARETAVEEIRRAVVISEIADVEGLEVTDEDWEAEASGIAQRYGIESEIVKNYLAGDDMRSTTHNRILARKTLGRIVELAEVTDKEVPREELEEAENTEKDA